MIIIKKLKSVNETEKRTDNILQNPKFINWFKGSKVVDKQGKPLVCFHGTSNVFDSFKILSHFGTSLAASEFTGSAYTWKGEPFNVTPVYLSIKNPAKIEDRTNSHKYLGIDLWQLNLLTYDELKKCYPKDVILYIDRIIEHCKNRDLDHTKVAIGRIMYNYSPNVILDEKELLKIMKSKGYDGFYYKNLAEDKGSISWIVFDPNQVWPIYKNEADELNEVEIFHDEGNETEKEKLYNINKAIQNKTLPEKEYNGYIFKIWDDNDTTDYIMMKDNKLVGVFSFENIKNFQAISYRWLSAEYRGKGLYEIFLQFLKTIMNITKIISDQLMTKSAISSTLKLQKRHKVEFINIDTNETEPVNQENMKKYITDDYDEDTFPWRFLITI